MTNDKNKRFIPLKHILPINQQKLWPELSPTIQMGFTLYGGTAIALRLGHRVSIDFDFFSDQPLDKNMIKKALPFMKQAETIQEEEDTWVVLTQQRSGQSVKLSFFGDIDFGRVGNPELTDDNVLSVASFDDLMATKLKVILQRAEAKDYQDIAAMINAGVSLSKGLSTAKLFYGSNFQPNESLKALTYFNDGDLNILSGNERQTLINAAKNIKEIKKISVKSRSLSIGNADNPKIKKHR